MASVSVTRYELRDATGVLVAVHCRSDGADGKRMWWERPDGSRGLGGIPVIDLPLYGIDRLDGLTSTVVIVEGEKAAQVLLDAGVAAVGTVTGAATIPSGRVLGELAGKRVIGWSDADAPGAGHMTAVLEQVGPVAAAVAVVVLPQGVPPGWDAAEAVAEGRDIAALLAAAVPYQPMAAPSTEATVDRLDPEADQTLLPSPSQPMGVVGRFVDDRYGGQGDGLVLRHWQGEFWRWHTSHWLTAADSGLRAEAYRYTEHAVYLKVVKGASTLEPWAPTRHKVADLMEALRAIGHLAPTIEMPSWLDERDHPPAAEFVACANGLLHVPTRMLRAHDQTYFNRVAVPFAYLPDAPPPTRWLGFLAELWPDDPEAIAALAEFFGYVISGRRNLHKILLLIGPTRAGKGVIARVLRALVGRGNYAGPTLASLGTNFGLSPLIGKPLAIVSDARLGGGANVPQVVERLLSVSGEDMLTVDVKYREPWTGTLPTRFVVISNELPRFGDASGAIANRFVVLTLRHSWLGRENPALTDELLTELPGILGWALDGLARLAAQDRFTEPTSSRDAIVTLADLVSPTSAFVRDRCEVDPTAEVPCAALYAAWKTWAEDNGHRAGSSSSFGRDLRAVLPSVRSVRPREDDRQRLYRGLRLLGTDSDPVHGPPWTSRPSEAAVQDGPGGPAMGMGGDGSAAATTVPPTSGTADTRLGARPVPSSAVTDGPDLPVEDHYPPGAWDPDRGDEDPQANAWQLAPLPQPEPR